MATFWACHRMRPVVLSTRPHGVEDKLGPDMAVIVEIRTSTRKTISYLLSPLVRYEQEALRER